MVNGIPYTFVWSYSYLWNSKVQTDLKTTKKKRERFLMVFEIMKYGLLQSFQPAQSKSDGYRAPCLDKNLMSLSFFYKNKNYNYDKIFQMTTLMFASKLQFAAKNNFLTLWFYVWIIVLFKNEGNSIQWVTFVRGNYFLLRQNLALKIKVRSF